MRRNKMAAVSDSNPGQSSEQTSNRTGIFRDVEYLSNLTFKAVPAPEPEDSNGETSLLRAVDLGDESAVRRCISQGANVNHKNLDGDTALHNAADKGWYNITKTLIDSGANVNSRNMGGETPLMYSCMKNHVDIVRLLIDAGAEIDAQDRWGETALFHVDENHGYDFFEFLVSAGANVNHKDRSGTTPLFINGYDVLGLLISAGANVNHQDVYGSTPLIKYMNKDSSLPHIIKLIESGANVNCRDYDGDTALIGACKNDRVDIVKYLLSPEVNADPNILNIKGENALYCTTNTEIKRCLIEHGARDISHQIESNALLQRDVFDAASKGDNRRIKRFIDEGGDVNIRDDGGKTLLYVCVERGNSEGVVLLLSAGTDVNIIDYKGETPLMRAIEVESLDMMKMLLKAGADTEYRNGVGQTALMEAIETDNIAIVDLLLSYDVDINAPNFRDGRSSLMLAAESGNLPLIKLLLSKGADVNSRDEEGQTALDISLEEGHLATTNCLLKAKLCQDLGWEQSDLVSVAKQCCERLSPQIGLDDIDNKTLLCIAKVTGHKSMVNLLKQTDKQLDLGDVENQRCMLRVALLLGQRDIVEKIIKSSDQIDLGYSQNITALMIAANVGNVKFLSFLLEKKAKVNQSDTKGWNPLMFSSQHGFVDCMEELINHGADTELQCDSGDTALSIAAANGHESAVRLLVERNANINCTNGKGFTPLMLACESGFLVIIKCLLSYRTSVLHKDFGHGICSIELQCDSGDTALSIAATNGDESAVRLLIGRGAKVNTKNKTGFTPIMLASDNGNLDVVKCLLSRSADLTCKDFSDGNTALHIACERDRQEIALTLISQLTDLNTTNLKNQTALHICSFHGHSSILETLILKRALLDIQDKDGNTALMLSVSRNNHDVTKMLVDAGAQTNLRNKENKTALVVGAEAGCGQSVDILLQTGQFREAEIEEARQVAQRCGQTDLVNLISHPNKSDDDDDLSGGIVEIRVKNSSASFHHEHRRTSYRMESKPRGLALIINVNNVRGKDPRNGTNVDRDNLKELLTQLWFDVTVYNDEDGLSAAEIRTKIKKFSEDPRHVTMDACIVCLLSHGKEGFIYGTDNQKVNMKETFDCFNNENCRALIEKPKIFFIQACRGSQADEGVQAGEDVEDSSLPVTSDMLKCYPTQAFYQAFRNTKTGSWFIEAIVKIFMKYAHCEDILTMMNRVNGLIARKAARGRSRDNRLVQLKQMSEHTSSFTKPRMFFFPGLPTDRGL